MVPSPALPEVTPLPPLLCPPVSKLPPFPCLCPHPDTDVPWPRPWLKTSLDLKSTLCPWPAASRTPSKSRPGLSALWAPLPAQQKILSTWW